VELTYRGLNERANRLAWYLRTSLGVQPGDAVGIMTRRSEKMVVALLGIMKAGAAYVPIDPRHPWDIFSYMIANAGIKTLLVDSASTSSAAIFDGRLLILDIELDQLPTPSQDPEVTTTAADLAYVIYTSGSSGKPKGVAVEHRSIVNTILWRNEYYGFGPHDVNLQMPSFAFDSSVVDIFCVLSAGGTLLIPQEDVRLDARYLRKLAANHGVTSFVATPSYYKLLIDELNETAPELRCVTLAGETITPDIVAAHARNLPHVTLFNEYGPTENAVCSTACILRDGDRTIPIGKPIANVKVFVLDENRRLCPVGVPGEIYLGGIGVARGYLNQDRLTADRFIPSPIPDFHDGVLYRTGDRGCWRFDGMLEFLGRLDNQVKVRGFRIELDAVENALLKHPGLRDAAVVCKDGAAGSRYLVAYAVPSAQLSRSDLRSYLQGVLPYYMVPDIFVLMPNLPLNLNGKVDRNLLRNMDESAGHNDDSRAAVSPLEVSLMAISSAVLNRAGVSVDDNFFELGGNSLRVMELVSRIRSGLSRDVQPLDIYTYPTIRELAHRLVNT
jgi:amino acid adenylation domain-containing protein